MDLTVAICTYKGVERLPEVLKCLQRQQVLPQLFTWEVLVVDNNSPYGISEIVSQFQEGWHPDVSLIYLFEAQQGLAYARRLAISKARSNLIAFLDDDNLPAETWVTAAYEFGSSHPKAGAYGSCIKGQYEIPPPPDFERIASCLAVIDRGNIAFRYDQRKDWILPAGAGLVVRKEAWLQAVPQRPVLAGVKGQSLRSKGEDLETLTYMQKAGWEIWHNPQMLIDHKIPAWRLERNYLFQLFHGVGLSRYPIRSLRFPRWQFALIVPIYFLKDLSELFLHTSCNFHLLGKDLVIDCERQLLRAVLMSPFYHWRLWFRPFSS